MEKIDVIVIGLDIFGFETATHLYKMGHNVLAVDKSRSAVNSIMNQVTEAVIADPADIDALTELQAGKFNTAVISLGANLEQMILAVTNLKKLGAANIVAKANQTIHEEILYKIGADKVVLPDREVAIKTSERIAAPGILDMIEIDDELQLVNVGAPKFMDGKTLIELDLRNQHGITVVMVKKDGKSAKLATTAKTIINEGDELIVAGSENDILNVFGNK